MKRMRSFHLRCSRYLELCCSFLLAGFLSSSGLLFVNSEVLSVGHDILRNNNDGRSRHNIIFEAGPGKKRDLLDLSGLLPPTDEEPPPTQGGVEGNENPNDETNSPETFGEVSVTEAPTISMQNNEASLVPPTETQAPTIDNEDFFSQNASTQQQQQTQFTIIPTILDDSTASLNQSASVAPSPVFKPGDWAPFNELLRYTYLDLPDTDIQQDLLFQPLTVSLKNFICSKINIQDLRVTPDFRSDQEVGIDLSVVNLSLECEFDFRWEYIFLAGNGHATVQIGDSSADIGLDIFSRNFTLVPPGKSEVRRCTTNILIKTLELSGNIASEIFNLFQELLVDAINGLINGEICDGLTESGASLLDVGLSLIFDLIDVYLEPVDAWRYNASYAELNMEVSDDLDLVSWNSESGAGELFDAVLDAIDDTLGSLEEDDTAPEGPLAFPNGTLYPNGYDLGVNRIIRKYLLNDDRALDLNLSTIFDDSNFSAVLLDTHDQLTETNLTLESIKIIGLDTFRNFRPLTRIGNYTLQNEFRWESMTIEAVLRLEMKASSLEDSFFRDPERVEPYEEEMKISISLEDIDVAITIMVALDTNQILQLKVGSIADLLTLVPCFISSMHDIVISGFNVSIGDIREPTIEGLVSPGLDRLLTDTIDAGFYMYKGTFLQAIPAIFQTTLRDLVTDALDTLSCPELVLPQMDSFLDMRDLLLDGPEALESGGAGGSPYGDLVTAVYSILQGLWSRVEDDGTLNLNSLIVTPLTETLSGEAGVIRIPQDLVNFTTNEENQQEFKSLVKSFDIALYDLKIENVNTIVHPMAILQPVNHPYITQSTVNLGPVEGRDLRASISMRMLLDVVDSPLTMNSEINFGLSVGSVEIFFELLTMVSTTSFLNFTLQDGAWFNCWLAMLPPPELDEWGYRIEGTPDRGVEIRRFLAKLSDLKLLIDCIECSPGLASLQEIVDILDRSSVTEILSYRIPSFAEEIAISDVLQVNFDRWLTDAPYKCPNSSVYNKNHSQPEEWINVDFKEISHEGSDTIFFSTIVAGQVAFVVLVETHYPWELRSLDPLSGQQNFVVPEGSELIDFMNISETLDSVSASARSYVGDERVDQDTGVLDLGINHFMRDFFLDDNGEVDIIGWLGKPIEFPVVGLKFFINSIKIRGLDTFSRFDILKPIAPQTVMNSIFLRNLEVEVDFSAGSKLNPPQHVVYGFKFEDLNATVPLFAAFELNKLAELNSGHLVNFTNMISCVLSTAADIHFPQVMISFGNFSEPTFTGLLPDSGEAVRESIKEVYERYGYRFLKALPVVFDVSARSFVNTFLADYIRDKAVCTHVTDRPWDESNLEEDQYNGFVDLRDLLLEPALADEYGASGTEPYGDIVEMLVGPVRDELLDVNQGTGMANEMNSIIRLITGFIGETGTLSLPGDLVEPLPFAFGIGALEAEIKFSLGDLIVENLDTIGAPLSLLMPIPMKPYRLDNSAGLGIGGRPLKISMRVSVDIKTFDPDTLVLDKDIKNDMIITLGLEEATAIFRAIVKASADRLVHFPLRDIFNVNCWLSLFPAPRLNELGTRVFSESSSVDIEEVGVSVKKLSMNITCKNCTSPGMIDLSRTLASPGASESVSLVANALLDYGSSLVVGNLVQDQIDRLLNEAASQCPHDPKFDPKFTPPKYDPLKGDRSTATSNALLLVFFLFIASVASGVVLAILVRFICRRRHKKWLHTLPTARLHLLLHQQEADQSLEQALNMETKSMLFAEEIPARVRYAMPFIILGNVAFFLSGHFSIAAAANLQFWIAGEPFRFESFFSFSVMDSSIDMWEAGAKEMAVFILLFSGLWPYAKQFTTLFCWLAPPSRLSVTMRGKIYLWLDILAKWSMVDIFVMILSMVSFRVKGSSPEVAFLPDEFFRIEVIVLPNWGLYANLLAQMISQVSSHFIISYHRKIVKEATRKYEELHLPSEKSDDKQSLDSLPGGEKAEKREIGKQDKSNRLCDAAYLSPHKGESSSKLVARQAASYCLVAGAVIQICFVFIGGALNSITVELQGVVGYLARGGDWYQEYSLFEMLKRLMDDAFYLGEFKYVAGYILLCVVLVATVVLVPVLSSLALAYHWFHPMTDKQRRKFSVLLEILAAWQYAEVWIMALLVSALQLGPTSEKAMAGECETFDVIFDAITYYGIVPSSYGHCFRIENMVVDGFYVLTAAAVVLGVINSFVQKASFQYFWEQEETRKELALDHHLTTEELAKPVDEKALKLIYPPPVLFTDVFGCLLRAEHLGDRPLHSIVVEEQPSHGKDHETNMSTGTTSS